MQATQDSDIYAALGSGAGAPMSQDSFAYGGIGHLGMDIQSQSQTMQTQDMPMHSQEFGGSLRTQDTATAQY